MKNRILGAIGVLWGGGMLVRMVMIGGPQGTGGYQAGQYAALAFGVVLLLAGLYYLVKGDG